jgi:hypothetical protein
MPSLDIIHRHCLSESFNNGQTNLTSSVDACLAISLVDDCLLGCEDGLFQSAAGCGTRIDEDCDGQRGEASDLDPPTPRRLRSLADQKKVADDGIDFTSRQAAL